MTEVTSQITRTRESWNTRRAAFSPFWWMIFDLRRSDHVSNALITLHWLCVPERLRFEVAVLMYKVFRVCPPLHLDPFIYVADLPSRRGLRSSCSACSSSLQRWKPKIFGCWPLGLELSANGGYDGTISGNSPHSTQAVSVHLIVSWHLTPLKFLWLHTAYSGHSSNFNT